MLTGTLPQSSAGNRADTLVARFIRRASSDPERVAFALNPMGALKGLGSLKWGDWLTSARASSGAFLAQHANPGDRAVIFANNRELWPMAAMSIAMTGMVSVAISPDASAEVLLAQLSDSGARFVMVDTMARFKMLRAVQSQVSQAITIVCEDLEPLRSSVAEAVFEWDTWCRYGAQALRDYSVLRDRLSERVDAIRANHACSITYAADGDVGIVRTFETVMADAEALSQVLEITFRDRITCVEPVSQPVHALFAIGIPIVTGATVVLVEHTSDAFAATRNSESTVFVGSSRSLSRLRGSLTAARSTGHYLRDTVCAEIGRHCRLIVTAETCSAEFQQSLRRAGVLLATVFGTPWQTCIAINGPTHFQDGAIGSAFENVNLRVSEYGELQVGRSAHTVAGYFNRNDASETAFSADGRWLRTGARVEEVTSGSFRIMGDMKDLLEFSTGRLLASHAIESSLSALPLVAHAVCDANGLNSLVAVLSLDRNAVEAWAFSRGVVATWEALVEHPLVYEELARGVAAVNAKHEPGERVNAFAPTDLEFSVHTGELDGFGALMRSTIARRFRHVFADLHQHRAT